jgi:hypothetical protein
MLQIEDYKKYMLTEDNINKNYCNFLHNNENMKNYNKKNEKYNNKDNNSREKTEYYLPYSTDKLFWCFYKIINESWDENENFRIEKEFKIDCIEKLRKNKNDLKPYKLTLTTIENDLLNERKITLKTLVALSILYKINLIYTFNNKYYELNNESLDNINNIHVISNINDKDSLLLIKKDLDYYRNNFYCIENINKPLKAISGYTIKELELMAKKLQIIEDDIKNINKKDLYQKISEKF